MWKENRVFSGNELSYPVELFISCLEDVAKYQNISDQELCQNAWDLIDSNKCSAAGVWKAKNVVQLNNWSDLKQELLVEFGRSSEQQTYNFKEKLHFVLSLVRGANESLTAYLSRVLWVVSVALELLPTKAIKGRGRPAKPKPEYIFWLRIMFLLGLQEKEQQYFVDQICLDPSKELVDIVQEYLECNLTHNCPLKKENEPLIEALKQEDLNCHDGDRVEVSESKDIFEEYFTQPEDNEGFFDDIKDDSNKAMASQDCTIAEHLGVENQLDDSEGFLKSLKGDEGTLFDAFPDFVCTEDSILPKASDVTGKKQKRNRGLASALRESLQIYHLKKEEDPATFRTFTSHLVRVGEQSRDTQWFCSYCRKEFGTKQMLSQHSTAIHQGKKFYCDICPDSDKLKWKSSDKLADHMFSKHKIVIPSFQVLQCSKCPHQAITPSRMERHEMEQHPEDKDSLVCKVCDKTFKSTISLKKHVQTHMHLQRFECDQCEKVFKSKGALGKHKYYNHGPLSKTIKKAKCEICGKMMKNEEQLQKHIKYIHDPEKLMPPAKCTQCGLVSKNKYMLKLHKQGVHGEKAFKCPLCPNESFRRRDVLQDHCMYHHIKIKPFVCAVCGAEFWQKLHMGAHIAEKHEKWPVGKAKKEWSILLKEKPHLFKHISIVNQFRKIMGEPPIKDDARATTLK